MSSSNTLTALQEKQQAHDEQAHRDILSMPFERRMTHMALHFAKYAGRLLAMDGCDRGALQRIVVDTAIITLTSANALEIRLDREMHIAARHGDLPDLSQRYGTNFNGNLSALPAWLGAALAIQNSGIAKACEAFDHGEDFPYREVLTAAVVSIAELVLTSAGIAGLDLARAVEARWQSVEEKCLALTSNAAHGRRFARTA